MYLEDALVFVVFSLSTYFSSFSHVILLPGQTQRVSGYCWLFLSKQ